MASNIAARYISRRLSSSGKILSEEEKAAENIYIKVLEGVIKYRWNSLPVTQRDGMKNYISDVIVKLSGDESSFRRERLYVNKHNIILVQILKHEWPSRWRSFIPDLVTAAKTNETICENCMSIPKLLSEEVFDFSRGEMTQQKIKELKESLNSEFQLIHELCLYVLSAASQRTELVRATLATLHAFLSWIPLGYIFESPLVAVLTCGDFYNVQFVKMYRVPFLTKAGKALQDRRTEIRVQFRNVPGNLYKRYFGTDLEHAMNELVIRVQQPDEAIYLKISNRSQDLLSVEVAAYFFGIYYMYIF